MSEKEVLAKVVEFRDKGYLKRIGAALRHQKVGYVANAMVVWQVPPEQIETVGHGFAQRPEVSHCYQRKVLPNWTYNIYTMLHGQTREEIYSTIQTMSDQVQITDYLVLFSTHEFKKSSMQYFKED